MIYSYLKGFGINRTIDYALAAGAVARIGGYYESIPNKP